MAWIPAFVINTDGVTPPQALGKAVTTILPAISAVINRAFQPAPSYATLITTDSPVGFGSG